MTARPNKTAADYMAIAICPALIMVLVGSLVFFLLEVGYAGAALGRLRWTLFWFVFAMILVSRIAMERSSGAAFLYGLALAAATSLMLSRYLGVVWGVWLLLGLVWWASHKIVWDCTLIDEDADASGQGLIQTSRFNPWARGRLTRVRAVPPANPASGVFPMRTAPAPIIPAPSIGGARSAVPSRSPKSRQPARTQELHAPGLWVLYFSIAAVPVFGLGELLLNPDDHRGRSIGFMLLLAYLGSALGLLLLTSFLGLRRYLRQRRMIMPAAMARGWVTGGIVLAVAVLLAGALLPRPATPYSLGHWVTRLSSPPEASMEQSSTAQDTDGGEAPAPETTGQGVAERGQTGRSDPSSAAASSQTSGPNRVPVPPLKWESWISYLAAVLIAAFLLIRYWAQICEALHSLAGWLRGQTKERREKKRSERLHPAKEKTPSLPANPFHTGQAARMSLEELVRYSYAGVRQWGQARGFVLDESETPLEFAERLSEHEPALTHEIRLLSSYYSRLIYGNQLPPEDCLKVLQSLWFVIHPKSGIGLNDHRSKDWQR